MDLNQKLAEQQTALIRASAARNACQRDTYLETAANLAAQIQRYQLNLGAAASCAWSASTMGSAEYLRTKILEPQV